MRTAVFIYNACVTEMLLQAQMAYLFSNLREPVLNAAIQVLQFPTGSRGLDAGCGAGLQAILLAETIGPAGHVTGLDLSPELLVHAKDVANRAGLSERISFRQGDVNDLPFDDDGTCLHTFSDDKKYALLLEGHELARARGGPRWMTMPLLRDL